MEARQGKADRVSRAPIITAPLLAAGVAEVSGTWWPARPLAGLWLLIAAFAVLFLSPALPPGPDRWRSAFRRLAGSMRALLVATLGTYGVLMGLAAVSLYAGRVPVVADVASALLRLFHVDAGAYERSVALHTLLGTPSIPMTWANAGVYSAAALYAAYVGLRLAEGHHFRLWELAASLFIVIVSALARLVAALALAVHETVFVDFDYKEFPVGILAAPLMQVALMALVFWPLMAAARTGVHLRVEPRAKAIRRKWVVWPLGSLAFLAAFLLNFDEKGVRKPGRVMIDEAHSQWEPVEPRYDTDWYGADSGYNYAVITDFLRAHYNVSILRSDINDASLKNVDVLVVKIPTRGYSEEERLAVGRFVRDGGGLLLVGEHTNVWGSGVYLNELAESFGIEFRYDVVFDLCDKFEERFVAPLVTRHPILAEVDTFLFAVSCSIRPKHPGVRPVMRKGGLWTLDADYGVDNFYPQADLSLSAQIQPVLQLAARRVGRGRIVGFTDSTVWSNFAAMLPGKPELLLGIVEWLNHSNRLPDLFPVGRFLALLSFTLASALAFLYTDKLGSIAASAVLGSLVGLVLGGFLSLRGFAVPSPSEDIEQVAFVANPSYDISMWGSVTNPATSYSIFFQWVMREGMFPRLISARDPLPASTRLVVTVLGEEPISHELAARIRSVLEADMPVLLLVRNQYVPSPEDLPSRYGLAIKRQNPDFSRYLRVASSGSTWNIPWASPLVVGGGRSILIAADGRPVMQAAAQVPLYVFIGADIFVDEWMGGDQSNTPDENLRRLYELEFAVVTGLVNDRIDGELSTRSKRRLAVRSGEAAASHPVPIDRPARKGHIRGAQE